MATKKKAFDAVTESRRWKEAVAQKTAGMNTEQVIAFFNRDKALARMQTSRGKTSRSVAH
jgi:hypothetical protein